MNAQYDLASCIRTLKLNAPTSSNEKLFHEKRCRLFTLYDSFLAIDLTVSIADIFVD